jgi:hypothetical protein
LHDQILTTLNPDVKLIGQGGNVLVLPDSKMPTGKIPEEAAPDAAGAQSANRYPLVVAVVGGVPQIEAEGRPFPTFGALLDCPSPQVDWQHA